MHAKGPNRKWFYIFESDTMTFSAAQSHCDNLGMKMAEFDTAEKVTDFLLTVYGSEYYLPQYFSRNGEVFHL